MKPRRKAPSAEPVWTPADIATAAAAKAVVPPALSIEPVSEPQAPRSRPVPPQLAAPPRSEASEKAAASKPRSPRGMELMDAAGSGEPWQRRVARLNDGRRLARRSSRGW